MVTWYGSPTHIFPDFCSSAGCIFHPFSWTVSGKCIERAKVELPINFPLALFLCQVPCLRSTSSGRETCPGPVPCSFIQSLSHPPPPDLQECLARLQAEQAASWSRLWRSRHLSIFGLCKLCLRLNILTLEWTQHYWSNAIWLIRVGGYGKR